MRGCYASRISHPVSRRFPSHRRQCFARVLGFQAFVVSVGKFPRRAIEFDLLERAQRDSLRAQIVVGVFALVDGARSALGRRRAKNGEEHEIGRPRCKHEARDQLEQLQRSAGQPVELLTQPLELGRRRIGRREAVYCRGTSLHVASPTPQPEEKEYSGDQDYD